MDRKLLKVQLTFEEPDGSKSVQTLDGEHAAEWYKIVNGYVGFQQARMGRADPRLGEIHKHWKIERGRK